MDRTSTNSVTYSIENIPTEQAMKIVAEVLPNVLTLFLAKNRDYGDTHLDHMRLGPKAQFVDIWRKVGKLKRAVWDGVPMAGEQPDEIFADFVGHSLLAILDYRDVEGV